MTNWSMEIHFTFHDVSINTTLCRLPTAVIHPLHSTMFLLIRRRGASIQVFLLPLHSTMFLLILQGQFRRIYQWCFTFHDVSINTSDFIDTMTFDRSLHSTMFLLIPLEYKTLAPSSVFTFHDVSINTALSAGAGGGVCFFTFHDVSINTWLSPGKQSQYCCFTFHDVSINTVRCR